MIEYSQSCACCKPSSLLGSSVKDSIDTDRPANIPSYLKPVRLNGPDAENVLKSFLRRNEKKIYRPLLNLWEKQRSDWTANAVKSAMVTGSLPADIEQKWIDEYEEIVAEVIGPVMLAGALRGATYMDESMTAALSGKSLPTGRELKELAEEAVTASVEGRAALLAVDFANSASTSAGTSLRTLIGANASAADTRFIMQNIVGLTPADSKRLISTYTENLKLGMKKRDAQRVLFQDAKQARGFRSQNISRSELANAFNQGAFDQVREQVDTGVLIGDRVVKQFLTVGDERVCVICFPLDGKIVGFESPLLADPTTRYFSYQQPPLHWGCRCVIIYVTYT
jgi:hypothetical protein